MTYELAAVGAYYKVINNTGTTYLYTREFAVKIATCPSIKYESYIIYEQFQKRSFVAVCDFVLGISIWELRGPVERNRLAGGQSYLPHITREPFKMELITNPC